MKKYAVWFVFATLFQLSLCACGRKEQSLLDCQPGRDIVSIGVSDGDKYAISPNTEGEATGVY